MQLFSGDATIKALKKFLGWIYWTCIIAYLDPNSTSGATKVGCYDFFSVLLTGPKPAQITFPVP